MRPKAIPIVLIVLMLGGILAVFGWHRSGGEGVAPVLLDDGSSMRMHNLQHLAVKAGATQWRLEATAAAMDEDQQQLALENLEVTYYLEGGAEVRLSAEKGVFETATQNIVATGNVRLNYQTYALHTQLMQYDHQQQTLQAPAVLQINRGESQLRADSMLFDLSTRAATFSGNVQGCFHAQL